MIRKCVSCGSTNVRRSKIRASERHYFRSPYHCVDCGTRFWVVAKKTYIRAASVGVAILAAFLISTRFSYHAEPAPSNPDAERFASTAELAGRNDPGAEYELAQMYAQGVGVPRNEGEARIWLARAAVHGNGLAQHELGNAYVEGRDVVQDYERAEKWLRLAAESGNARAQFELGLMYRDGKGMPVDKVTAYTWFNIAAAQGVVSAASARDAVLGLLSPAEVIEAQTKARQLSETLSRRTTAGR